MGRFCRVCGRVRANERFSGRGHKRGVCKECHAQVRALQRSVRKDRGHSGVEREIACMLEQIQITEKNMTRLEDLSANAPGRAREMAALALEVARIAPERKIRLRRLRQAAPGLVERLREYRLAVWEDRRVKHPERRVRERIEAEWMAAEAERATADVEDLPKFAFIDPCGYYEPDSTDAFYWAYIRDDEDQRAAHCTPRFSRRLGITC